MKIHKRADVGYITNFTVANPAAGAGFVVNSPVGIMWKINSLRFQLVTSAAVANRIVLIQVFDGTDELGSIITPMMQPASIGWTYNLVDGLTSTGTVAMWNVSMPWRGEVWINWGYGLRILVDNMDAADQITNIRGRAEAWCAE